MTPRWIPVCLMAAMAVAGCENKVPEPEGGPVREPIPAPTGLAKLVKKDHKVGKGTAVKTGDKVKVHYTGKLLKTNAKFDSSRDKDKPFEFTIGEGQVIKGWEEGVVGMKPGGERELQIPAKLAYGDKAKPNIPANSDLKFDIELIEIVSDEPPPAASGSASASASASAKAKDPPKKKKGDKKKAEPKKKAKDPHAGHDH